MILIILMTITFILGLSYIIVQLIDKKNLKKLQKNYDPNDDLSKKGQLSINKDEIK